MHVHQLQDFAFGDDVGGVGEHVQHAHAAHFHHQLEGARIEEVADQHAGGVAEQGVGGGAAAAQRRFVDDVVVQQGGRVDELDDRRQLEAAVARERERAREQQHEARPDPLAAGADDVVRDLVDERDFGREPTADHVVDGLHLGSHRIDRQGRVGQGGVHVGSGKGEWAIIGRPERRQPVAAGRFDVSAGR